jgi:hypothetical protein
LSSQTSRRDFGLLILWVTEEKQPWTAVGSLDNRPCNPRHHIWILFRTFWGRHILSSGMNSNASGPKAGSI